MANKIIEEKASYWLSLENEGQNLNDNQNFQSWIEQNEKHKKVFKEQKELLKELYSLPDDFLNKLKSEVKQKREIKNRRKKLFMILTPISSVACLLVVLYFSIFTKETSFSKQYIASNKVLKNIIFPDKSSLFLDVNTKADVRYFDDKREVFLSKGRAFFSVKKDITRPFLIKTDKANIKVLGTKFEVVNASQKFLVNVTEGKVRVSNQDDKLLALVSKGQSLTLDEYLEVKSLKKKENQEIANWTLGKFNFYQKSLDKVLKEFSKYIDIDVKIEDKNLRRLPISGNFDAYHFNDFLKVLPLVHPIKVIKNQDKIILKQKI